jgi:hypothetical protein
MGSVFLLLAAANAQIVFRRVPTGSVTQPAPTPQAKQADTRRADDQVIQVQPTPDREQRAQRRRGDDGIFQIPQPQRIPDMQRPQLSPPYLFASPTQVRVKPGETFGYTGLVWDAGEKHPYAEVWKQVDDGAPQFVLEKGKGQTGAQIDLGKTYKFILTDFGETLDTVTVTATREIVGDLPGGIIKRPGRETEANMITYITDVQTEPRNNGAVLAFFAPSSASPVVEIGSAKPILVNGRYVFRDGSRIGSGNAVASRNIKKVGVEANTYHRFDFSMPIDSWLEAGTKYWFIVTGQNPSGQPDVFQTTGDFNTPSQRVRVVFESIKIVNSSDDKDLLTDGGEIDLWFWVNFGQATERRFKIQNLNDNRAFTNYFYDLKREFIIEDAPNSLVLDVQGKEDDTFAGQGNDSDDFYVSPRYGPKKTNTNDYEWNYASDKWDLGRFSTKPGEPFRQQFKLVSMPNGGDQGNLSFEVHGYWEITRRN